MTELSQTNVIKGIMWMLLTMLMFVTMDACAKYLLESISVVQTIWGRYFFQIVILVIVFSPRLKTLVKTQNMKLQLIRSLLLLMTTGLFFFGLKFLPMANASALMLTSPIFVTALSILVLKEQVGLRRWAGIMVGFIGALIIIRPGSGVFDSASLLIVGAATSYACYQISTRFLSHSDSVQTTLLYSATLGTVVLSLAVPFFWIPPSLEVWGLLVAMGVFGCLGHFALIKALSLAPVSTVAPFTFTNLIWASLFGYILFDDIPDFWTIVGAVIIICSGLYIFFREHVRKKI